MNQTDKIETCLIQLDENVSSEHLEMIKNFIKMQGGVVLLWLLQQKVLIINVNVTTKEGVKLLPGVKFISGVRMRPREVPKIRVREKLDSFESKQIKADS